MILGHLAECALAERNGFRQWRQGLIAVLFAEKLQVGATAVRAEELLLDAHDASLHVEHQRWAEIGFDIRHCQPERRIRRRRGRNAPT